MPLLVDVIIRGNRPSRFNHQTWQRQCDRIPSACADEQVYWSIMMAMNRKYRPTARKICLAIAVTMFPMAAFPMAAFAQSQLSEPAALQTPYDQAPYDGEFMVDSVVDSTFGDADAGSSSDSLLRAEMNRMQLQIDELNAARGVPTAAATAKPKPAFPTARLTGFFQADAAWFGQDDANRLAVGNGDPVAGDIQDGADFRRARLAAVGEAWDNVAYQVEFDFAFPGRPSFMDVWLDINNVIGNNHLRVGHFRQPFGMDGLTSVRELTFLERAVPSALLPFRQIGALWYGNTDAEDMTWAISAFRYPTDVFGGNIGDNGGYAMATRVTGLLFDRPGDGGRLHIGAAYSHLDPASDAVQYRNQPEIFVA